MSGEFPFAIVGSLGAPGFFGAKKKVTAGGGGTVRTFHIISADSGTGPFGVGTSGEGWAANNATIANPFGSAIPVNPNFAFVPIFTTCFIGGSNTFVITLNSQTTQNFFTSVFFTDRLAVLETYLTVAATFDTVTHFPNSVWSWPALLNSPFTNSTDYLITMTGP